MRSTRTHSPACAGFHAAAFNRRHALKVGGHDPLLVTQNPNDPAFALPELSLPADITPGLRPRKLAACPPATAPRSAEAH